MKFFAKAPIDCHKIFPDRQSQVHKQFVLGLLFSRAEAVGGINQCLTEIEKEMR